ncbi:hypothetical protein [Aeromicrobium sp. CF3.5]|uniref:hypothetical protein n=1 Tax=Aeromicrobium sp. CF3.5 TaxID=3373078 RepID=UPI003EE4D431
MSENATDARRDGREPRRARHVTKIAGLGVVTGALVVAGLQLPATAAATNVLQAVDVQVSGDGTLTSISSTTLSQQADGVVTDDEITHDPSKTGSELPVRVLTSYRYEDGAGTDLTDLEGVSGRVYIDVTVQNTTVAPELLSYNSDAENKTAPALVGTPLTVVASADLGDSDLGDVVVGEPGTEERVTNGVVSRDTGGDARVQWATMLAPPRLAPSATFTLVQEVEDFEPPTFDISVQPGLVTDTSLSQLVDSAFTDDNGTRELTTSTIALLSSVGSVLTDASTVLAKVEEQLDASAGDLGSKTISDLESSATFVTSALGGLSTDLDSLDSSIASSLSSSSDAAVQQLGTSFTEVKEKVLGDANSYKAPPSPPRADGCEVMTPDGSNQSTVFAQLRDVEEQLKQLAGATDGCRDAVVGQLNDTIGTVNDKCEDQTAQGALTCATGAIGNASTALTSLRDTILGSDTEPGIFKPERLERLQTNYDEVFAVLDPVRTRIDEDLAEGGVGGEFDDIEAELEQVRTALEGVDGALALINERAEEQLTLLRGNRGALEQAADLADVLCDDLPETPESNRASALLSGTDCAGQPASAPGYDSSLLDKIDATATAWETTRAETDTDAADSLGSFVDDLLDRINGIIERYEDLIEDGQARSLQQAVDQIDEQLDGVYEDRPQPDDADGNPQPDLPDFRGELQIAFDEFVANQTNVTNRLEETFNESIGDVEDNNQDAGEFRQGLDDARARSEEGAGSLFDEFSASLSGIGEDIVENGAESIDRQKDALDAEASDFEAGLTGTVQTALDRIGSQVGESNGELASSETQLVEDLQAILVNIGTPQENGSGLLGTIFTGARSTGASNEQIVDASQLSDAFSRVRGTSLDDLFLQQAQVRASLEAEESFGAFDLDLADSTSARTVFSFHIGQD